MTLVLGSAALMAAVGLVAWSLISRPSAAHANLVVGLGIEEDGHEGLPRLMRRVGETARRTLPRPLIDGLEVNIVQAGHPGGLDLARVIGIKCFLAVIAGASLLLLFGPIAALIGAVVLFFLPDYWILSVRDDRQAGIRKDAADVIDQITICVEAGLGFDAALARVASTSSGPFTDELRRTLADLGAGVPRARALRALGDRTDVPEVRQLVTALLQAHKHGVSLAGTLRVQSAELRRKRTQRTEERAAKLAVKMIFPIVVCFLPVFLIVTVAPSLISIFRAL